MENKEISNTNEKKNIRKPLMIAVMTGVLVLIGILGTYAFFVTSGTNQNENLSVQTGTMSLTFSDGSAAFTGGPLEFGNSATKTFTITNGGSLDAVAKINWKNLTNTYTDGSLTYTLSYSETESGTYTEVVTNKNVPRSATETTTELANGLIVPAGKTYYYKLVITLNYLESTDQTADLNAVLSTAFDIEEGQTIARANEVIAQKIANAKSSTELNFANPAITDETADGLYSMEDDYGTSYFYRGAVEDNYVKFGKWSADAPDVYFGYYSSDDNGDFHEYTSLSECQNAPDYNSNCTKISRAGKDMYWRIIRINGDGSVRLIYDGDQAYENGVYDEMRFALNEVSWNTTNGNDVKFVGYMYGGLNTNNSSTKRIDLGQSGYEDSENAIYNETSSNIKIKLEDWYVANIKNQGLDEHVSDEIFCNDRSFASNNTGTGIGTSETYYGASGRVGVNTDTVAPQFTCPNKNDSFTKSDTEKGNGKLSEKIGLITVDEIVAAGGTYGYSTNRKYYLYKGLSYISGSPSHYFSIAMNFYVSYHGTFRDDSSLNSGYRVAPVINLSAEYFNTLVGDGTIGNEYRAE